MMSSPVFYANNPEHFMSMIRSYSQNIAVGVFCVKGQASVCLEEKDILLNARQLLFVQSNIPIKEIRAYAGAKVHMLGVKEEAQHELIHFCMREDKRWWDKSRLIASAPVLSMSEQQATILNHYGELFRIISETDEIHNPQIALTLLQSSALEILEWYNIQLVASSQNETLHGRADILFRRFLHLLQQQEGRKEEVQWYAEQLAITPKYLTTICHMATGKSASDMIAEATTNELKRMLLHTDLSSKEIAERLQFITPSFFCKFVKRELGMNAKEYRQLHRQ